MATYIGVSIIILAVFLLLLMLALTATVGLGGGSFNQTVTNHQPTNLYHGTTFENAIEIYVTGLWLIGSSLPPAVWMTDDFEIAKEYSGQHGAIVQVHVDRGVRLTKPGGRIYIFKVPGAVAHGEYYRIEGITPIAVLNPQGNPIQ
jgi:hypothetical protein